MNLLLIEDQEDFIEKVQRACSMSTTTLLTPDSINLKDLHFTDNEPIEDQLAKRLQDLVAKHDIDLVLLDTDLSRAQAKLRTQTEYRQAFQSLGVPACRYRKGQSTTKLAALEVLQRLAIDGSSAVWVPKDLLDGDLSQLINWLEKVAEGFRTLTSRLRATPDVLQSPLGPSGILADILDRPDLKSDLLGYTAQNFFFFAASARSATGDQARLYATQLGYWLLNYVLAFPGPILNPTAAAAYLNLLPESFDLKEVHALVEACRYRGPFEELGPYYWKDDLGELLNQWDGDIALAPSLKAVELKRVDADAPQAMAYYCVLNGEVIKESDAAINPDWIPPGAQLSRITESEFDELGPMLKI